MVVGICAEVGYWWRNDTQSVRRQPPASQSRIHSLGEYANVAASGVEALDLAVSS